MAKRLTDEQKASRVARRTTILTAINGSGRVPDPMAAAALAAEIEGFEWGTDGAGRDERSNLVVSIMGKGTTPPGEIVATATAMLETLNKF